MADATQTLEVDITGDVSGLSRATRTAATELADLQTRVQALDSEAVDIGIETGAETAQTELNTLQRSVDRLDGEAIEIPADVEMQNVDRDLANLRRILDGLERRKANPDVGLDITQFLAQERKVQREIAYLEKRRAQIGVDIDTTLSSAMTQTVTTNMGAEMASHVVAGFTAGLSQGMGQAFSAAMPGLRSSITGFAGMMSGVTSDAARQSDALREVYDQLLNVNLAMRQAEVSGKHVEGSYDAATIALGAAVGAYNKLAESTGTTTSKLQMLGREFALARAEGASFFDSIRTARSLTAEVSSGLTTMAGDAEDAGVPLGAAAGGLRAIGAGGSAAALGLAAAGGAAVVAGVQLGQMAADVETMKIQLDALSGGKADVLLPQLQQFAKESPFALDEVTAAAKRLLAAGVELQDLPQYLEQLGEVSAATGTPLSQIATIFGQMESKGKATYEELAQLSELGVGVWQPLADGLGLTVEEVQQLATQGKLGADAIALVRAQLGGTYSGTMARQAETYNGLMSTFRDTLTQTGQTLGTLFLPALTDAAELLNDVAGAALWASEQVTSLNSWMEDTSGLGIGLGDILGAGFGFQVGPGWDEFKEQMGIAEEETSESSGNMITDIQTLAEKVNEGLQDAETAAANYKLAIEEAFAPGIEVRTRVSFIFSMDDLAEEIRKATSGKDAITLPADLDLRGLRNLGERQEDVVSDLSSFVQQGLEEGARRAELNPKFDVEAWNAKVYGEARELSIKAGIDRTNVDAFLQNVLGITPTINVHANTGPATTETQEFVKGTHFVKTVPVESNTAPAAAGVQSFVQRRTGKMIYVNADTAAYDAEMIRITATRTVDVIVNAIGSVFGGGGGGGGGSSGGGSANRSIVPQQSAEPLAEAEGPMLRGLAMERRSDPTMVGSTAAYGRPGFGGTALAPTGRAQLRPPTTPVKVFLDGQEIADHLTMRASRLGTGSSGRRRP